MALTINTRAFYENATATTTRTLSITLNAGTSRKLVVTTMQDNNTAFSDLTFDGTSFLANLVVDRTHTNAITRGRQYYYDIPDVKGAGSYDIVLTSALSTNLVAFEAQILFGAATGTAESTNSAEAATTVSAVVSAAVTSTADAAVIAGAVGSFSAPTITWSGDVTERAEGTVSGYRPGFADSEGNAAGSRTATATFSSTDGDKVLVVGSYAAAVTGPTIDTQPTAQTVIRSNGTSTTFTVAAITSGGSLTYQWQLEDSVGAGTYTNVADGSGLTFTGGTSASLGVTCTTKAATGRKVRCNVTDDNGTTDTNAVALTIFDGPQVTAFGPTDVNGETTATLTCDYVTGTGEAIEVAIVLPDGRVSVSTVVT